MMFRMFSGCKSLRVLDISRFDTRSLTKRDVEGMPGEYQMFDQCKSLKRIALGKYTRLKNSDAPGGKWTRIKLLNGKKPSKKVKIKLMKKYTGKYPGWYTR